MNEHFSREKVRFAPSPTGYLHVGNIRIALINYLFAQKNNGVFVLRIDNTDLERSTKEFEENILSDLKWLGLNWDEFYKQSNNIFRYDQTMEYLKSIGRIYECYETKEELALKRKIEASKGIPPVYDRAALKLTNDEKLELQKKGIKPYWRFKLNESETVLWNDLIHGEISVPLSSISDPILIKPDGGYTYTFASVVDDIDMEISTIIRGDDHITNTAVQIDMFNAIRGYAPDFAHVPLMSSLDGQDVSKRTNSPFSIINMRKSGIYPEAILNVLASIGTPNPVVCDSLQKLVSKLNLSKMSLSAVKFNLEDVKALNKKILSNKSFSDVESDIRNLGIDISEEIWEISKHNLNNVEDIKYFKDMIDGKFLSEAKLTSEDKEFLNKILSLIDADFNYENWISEIKKQTMKKGRSLFHPIRIALTGLDTGPELHSVCDFLGPEEIKNRIKKML